MQIYLSVLRLSSVNKWVFFFLRGLSESLLYFLNNYNMIGLATGWADFCISTDSQVVSSESNSNESRLFTASLLKVVCIVWYSKGYLLVFDM